MVYLVHHFLEKSADISPVKEAVVCGKDRRTYSEIEERANWLANGLLDVGLSRGDRVALLLRNSVAYVSCYYGVLKMGGVVVPLNTGLAPQAIIEILSDCSPAVLIFESQFNKVIQEIKKYIPKMVNFVEVSPEGSCFSSNNDELQTLLQRNYGNHSKRRPQVQLIDKDLSSIIYTSGSTGRPKGVMLTHQNIVSNTLAIVSYLNLSSKDRCMAVLPFHYVYGKSLLNTHFAVSGTIVVDNRFAFPSAVLENMIKEKVTGFAGVPSTYSILVKKTRIEKMHFPDLRYLTQAGGHMSSSIKQMLLDIFPDKRIYVMYGATEASARLSYLEPDDLPLKINSIGKAIPNVELKVFTKNGVEAKCNDQGEIAARGSNIMPGYWSDRLETEKVLRNGWYYTGDLGYQDEEGFFYITGRKRDMIKVGVFKVSANEIEDILYRHHAVIEAAVIGVSDEILGEVPRAFVVINEKTKTNVDELLHFCSEYLQSYKIPKGIEFRKNLPKNGAGKILKSQLTQEH